MAWLHGPKEEEDHVLSITPCKPCQARAKDRGDQWEWGRCYCPNESDAALIPAIRNAAPALIAAIHARAATMARLSADLAAAKADNERLILDVEKNSDPVAHCEGCGAPLFADEDWVSGEDCSGCWHAVTDAEPKRERPCFAYRVGKPDARAVLAKLSEGKP
jgi:hypothetical protein